MTPVRVIHGLRTLVDQGGDAVEHLGPADEDGDVQARQQRQDDDDERQQRPPTPPERETDHEGRHDQGRDDQRRPELREVDRGQRERHACNAEDPHEAPAVDHEQRGPDGHGVQTGHAGRAGNVAHAHRPINHLSAGVRDDGGARDVGIDDGGQVRVERARELHLENAERGAQRVKGPDHDEHALEHRRVDPQARDPEHRRQDGEVERGMDRSRDIAGRGRMEQREADDQERHRRRQRRRVPLTRPANQRHQHETEQVDRHPQPGTERRERSECDHRLTREHGQDEHHEPSPGRRPPPGDGVPRVGEPRRHADAPTASVEAPRRRGRSRRWTRARSRDGSFGWPDRTTDVRGPARRRRPSPAASDRRSADAAPTPAPAGRRGGSEIHMSRRELPARRRGPSSRPAGRPRAPPRMRYRRRQAAHSAGTGCRPPAEVPGRPLFHRGTSSISRYRGQRPFAVEL